MDKKYFPNKISSERIHLNKLDKNLADQMFNCIDEDRDRLNRFLPWPQFINTVDDEIEFVSRSSVSWIKYERADFSIFRNEDNEYIGNIGLFNLDWNNESCEIGYWILGKYEGSGFIRDSVTILEREIYKIGFNRIVIMCEEINFRSKIIPKSLGYTFEGILREYKKENGHYVSREVYSKLKREYDVELKS